MTAGFIDAAIQKNTDDRLEFRVGNATELPFDDSSYDQVMAQLVLQFVPDADVAISEMVRLAAAGQMIIRPGKLDP